MSVSACSAAMLAGVRSMELRDATALLLPGRDPPRLLQADIEIMPFDPVKYGIDNATGYLYPQGNAP